MINANVVEGKKGKNKRFAKILKHSCYFSIFIFLSLSLLLRFSKNKYVQTYANTCTQ